VDSAKDAADEDEPSPRNGLWTRTIMPGTTRKRWWVETCRVLGASYVAHAKRLTSLAGFLFACLRLKLRSEIVPATVVRWLGSDAWLCLAPCQFTGNPLFGYLYVTSPHAPTFKTVYAFFQSAVKTPEEFYSCR